jgi:hypothetical protein
VRRHNEKKKNVILNSKKLCLPPSRDCRPVFLFFFLGGVPSYSKYAFEKEEKHVSVLQVSGVSIFLVNIDFLQKSFSFILSKRRILYFFIELNEGFTQCVSFQFFLLHFFSLSFLF